MKIFKILGVLVFNVVTFFYFVSLISCSDNNENNYQYGYGIYTKHIRNGYDVYCFKYIKKVRGMDSIYYKVDSVKHNDPPSIFYEE